MFRLYRNCLIGTCEAKKINNNALKNVTDDAMWAHMSLSVTKTAKGDIHICHLPSDIMSIDPNTADWLQNYFTNKAAEKKKNKLSAQHQASEGRHFQLSGTVHHRMDEIPDASSLRLSNEKPVPQQRPVQVDRFVPPYLLSTPPSHNQQSVQFHNGRQQTASYSSYANQHQQQQLPSYQVSAGQQQQQQLPSYQVSAGQQRQQQPISSYSGSAGQQQQPVSASRQQQSSYQVPDGRQQQPSYQVSASQQQTSYPVSASQQQTSYRAPTIPVPASPQQTSYPASASQQRASYTTPAYQQQSSSSQEDLSRELTRAVVVPDLLTSYSSTAPRTSYQTHSNSNLASLPSVPYSSTSYQSAFASHPTTNRSLLDSTLVPATRQSMYDVPIVLPNDSTATKFGGKDEKE